MRLRWIGVPSVLLALTVSAFGWSDLGHRIIVAVAERDLSPTAKMEAARLLGIEPSLGAPFWEAGTWADDNRTAESGPWHYINLHFRTDGKRTTNQPEPENVDVAITRFEAVLSDRSKSDEERKTALLYVLHFVGDAHQPLHAVARDTDRYPKGDRGGNDFAILPPEELAAMNRPPRNLHSLWDGGAGLFTYIAQDRRALDERILAQAETLRASFPERSLRGAANLNPMDWSREGLEAAKKVVYRLDEGTAPSAAYMAAAREVCAKRATLAGYRLAAVLNRCLTAPKQ